VSECRILYIMFRSQFKHSYCRVMKRVRELLGVSGFVRGFLAASAIPNPPRWPRCGDDMLAG
jgi:hypothetical protein